MKEKLNKLISVIKENINKEDNNFDIIINIKFPDNYIIQLLDSLTDINIYQEGDYIKVLGNKQELNYLQEYINGDEKLKKLTDDIIKSLKKKTLIESIINIEGFTKYLFPSFNINKNIILPLFTLLNINITHRNENPNNIIGYEEINKDITNGLYSYDIEVTNFKTNLFQMFHYNIINSNDNIAKYNGILIENNKYINEIFPRNNNIKEYINEVLINSNISIYNGIIRSNSEVKLKLKGKQRKIISLLNSHKKDGGISRENLKKESESLSKEALEQSIKRIRTKLKKIGLSDIIQIKYIKLTESYNISY